MWQLFVLLIAGAAVAFGVAAHRHRHDQGRRAVTDLDELLGALSRLSHVGDLDATGRQICRIATDLTGGTGAGLLLQGPGRVVVVAHHGIHPPMRDPELGVDGAVERVLRGGGLTPGNPLLIPLASTSGVVGAVSVSMPQRHLDELRESVLGLFGWAGGSLLERFGAVIDVRERDPITGVGERRLASAAIASLRTGDALVVFEVHGIAAYRRSNGDEAADLVQGHLGLHLRNAIRPGDSVVRYDGESFLVVLREVRGPVDLVVGRILDTWAAEHPHLTLHAGAALHTPRSAPIDTAESAHTTLLALLRG